MSLRVVMDTRVFAREGEPDFLASSRDVIS